MKKLIPLLFVALVTGCGHFMPASQIQITPDGRVKLYLPQDREIEQPEVIFSGGSNWTFRAKSIKSRNNPAALKAGGQANVLIIREGGKVVGGVVEKAVSAATP